MYNNANLPKIANGNIASSQAYNGTPTNFQHTPSTKSAINSTSNIISDNRNKNILSTNDGITNVPTPVINTIIAHTTTDGNDATAYPRSQSLPVTPRPQTTSIHSQSAIYNGNNTNLPSIANSNTALSTAPRGTTMATAITGGYIVSNKPVPSIIMPHIRPCDGQNQLYHGIAVPDE